MSECVPAGGDYAACAGRDTPADRRVPPITSRFRQVRQYSPQRGKTTFPYQAWHGQVLRASGEGHHDTRPLGPLPAGRPQVVTKGAETGS